MKHGLWIVPALVVLTGGAGWLVTDELEQSNEFCVACHLDSATPLHETKMDEFMAYPEVNLVSLHRVMDRSFLCIDCHGGTSFQNKFLVKTVAARDTALYLLGSFGEPSSMVHPLWDEDCARCHGHYEALRDDDFHAIDVHNLPDFEYRCVDCHLAHPRGGRAEFGFLKRDLVLQVCRNCHEEF